LLSDVCRIVQLLAKSGDQAAAVRAPQDDAQALMELAVLFCWQIMFFFQSFCLN
jgi:hypothetical protein